jgi:hypothetical protein
MRNILLLMAATVALVALVIPLSQGDVTRTGEAAGSPRVLSVLGVGRVQGEDVLVDIWLVVFPGQDEQAVSDAALRAQGARRANAGDLMSADFTTSGLVWDQFFDADQL